MAGLYWASRERKRLLTLAAGIFIVIATTAHMQVRLNAWNQPFYDALTRKDLPDFIRQLGVFAKAVVHSNAPAYTGVVVKYVYTWGKGYK